MTKRWILGILLVLLALAGHLWYHYLPRARPAVPRGESPVAAVLDAADFPAALWVPYPHQNLVHLRAAMGAEPASTRAIARLAGLPSPALPTFGPLALPPSSEIAVASDDTGEHFVVVAQVYPTVAAFAKLAGRLAGNPWLHGGEIIVEGRPAEVSWQGNRWMVASSELAQTWDRASGATNAVLEAADDVSSARLRRDAGREPTEPGLAWIRIRQAVDPLPAGLYRLWQGDGDLGITSGVAPPSEEAGESSSDKPLSASSGLAERLETLGLFLLVFSGGHPALGEPAQALAFFDQQEEQVMEMPRVAALHEPGTERWDLPGEGLLEIAQRPLTASADGWSIAAFDSISLNEARRIVPELDAVAGDRLKWGLWLDLRGGLAELERIARLLAKIPFVPRRQVERWNDARLALSPLAARYSDLTATVADQPGAPEARSGKVFELRLKAMTPK